jgi:hypothetical protein
VEALRLSSSEVPGDPLDLLCSRVIPHSSTIGDCTADYLRIYLPGSEQATPLHRHGEPSKGELLVSKLPLYSVKVTLLPEFTVDLNA